MCRGRGWGGTKEEWTERGVKGAGGHTCLSELVCGVLAAGGKCPYLCQTVCM